MQRRARTGAIEPAVTLTGPTGAPSAYLFDPATIDAARTAK